MLYAGIIFAILVLAYAYWMGSFKIRSRRLRMDCEAALASVYSESRFRPTLTMDYAFGYPSFSIEFEQKQDIEAAAALGLNEKFISAIARTCRGRVRKNPPFEARKAIFFRHVGWINDLKARHRP